MNSDFSSNLICNNVQARKGEEHRNCTRVQPPMLSRLHGAHACTCASVLCLHTRVRGPCGRADARGRCLSLTPHACACASAVHECVCGACEWVITRVCALLSPMDTRVLQCCPCTHVYRVLTSERLRVYALPSPFHTHVRVPLCCVCTRLCTARERVRACTRVSSAITPPSTHVGLCFARPRVYTLHLSEQGPCACARGHVCAGPCMCTRVSAHLCVSTVTCKGPAD